MRRPNESASPRKRPWLPDALASIAISTGVGYAAAAYTVSRWLTRPMPGRPKAHPEEFGLYAEPFHVNTSDRLRLRGWVITPPEPRGTIVVTHGLHQNRTHTLNRCALLVHAGYRCVAFDHRAHGESAGKRTSFGYHEARDVEAVFEMVTRRWPNEPLGALGLSMGAAALCFAASHVRACRAIILESCYYDISHAFENRLRHGYPPWFQRLTTGVIWVTEQRLKIKLPQLSPARHVADLAPAATFFMTGTDDPHATPEECRGLYDKARGAKELWYVPHAGHKDVFEIGGAMYRERVLDFLDIHLKARRLAA